MYSIPKSYINNNYLLGTYLNYKIHYILQPSAIVFGGF